MTENTLITIFQKQYFNNKSLTVFINYALLGFYLCHFGKYEYV